MSTSFSDELFLIMFTIMRIIGLGNSVSSLAESDKGSSTVCKSEECITMSMKVELIFLYTNINVEGH